MSESGDYSPAAWAGHDFNDARRAYDSHVGRSYKDATSTKTKTRTSSSRAAAASTTNPNLGKMEAKVQSLCLNPLMIWSDVTGSMGQWPATMFSKLPFLEHEANHYLGEGTEICFCAVGDAYSDKYPIQVRPFEKGVALKDRMLELVIEGKGGGQMCETYELAALYALYNVDIPNAIKPVFIMIGDEKPYPSVSPDMAKFAGVTIQAAMTAEEIFTRLKQKFEVFLIRKPYSESSGNSMSSEDKEIHQRWVELLGADRVVDLPDPNRVVDVIFGILAKVVNRFDEFKEEIEDRQDPNQVKTVYKSLATIHAGSAASPDKGKSIMMLPGGDGAKTRSLLGQ